MEQKDRKWMLPFLGIYLLITVVSFSLGSFFAEKQINIFVVLAANTILLAFSLLNLSFQQKNINNPNSAAVIRGLMAGTFLKLMGLAAAALIYLVAAGANRSVNAVFIGMGLYIVYTWLEVRVSLRMKPKK
jgi:sorbitol-specific phosphotransferase system component IIC